mmetsp:Transcript_14154/g.38887  ORF Transcript_14154/g.38887 Transcript_14154/m.38887 type:complete len:647 (+) Transcript_14154:64-2004(+)
MLSTPPAGVRSATRAAISAKPLYLAQRAASGGEAICGNAARPHQRTTPSLTCGLAGIVGGSASVAVLARRRHRGFARQQLVRRAFRRTGIGLRNDVMPSSRTAAFCTANTAGVDIAKPVPVVLLSGFLGTGKTTLLKHWLEDSEGRIGVVVNDVASVNIDAKMVKQRDVKTNVETIELQNGCACCSLGDELMTTIYDLVSLAEGGEPFRYIVVELSGVAEPKRVCEMFQRSKEDGFQAQLGVEFSKVVTLLDASTFCKEYMEFKRMGDRPDLMESSDFMSESAESSVVSLLVEQAEAADVVVLNKVDLASADDIALTRTLVSAMNEKAEICQTSFGKVPLSTVLGGGHPQEATSQGHSHGGDAHEHGHGGDAHEHGKAHDSADSAHSDESHDDSHIHRHGPSGHSHEGSSHEEHAHGCDDPACTDESHAHSHSHAHDHGCDDPECTDASHGHSHSHAHGSSSTTAEDRFGITSFTYRARRPFHTARLQNVILSWPVPVKECLGDVVRELEADAAEDKTPLTRVIRSKGFCWIDSEPSSRMYLCHAGKHMMFRFDGVWWGAMSQEQLKLMRKMASAEYDRARREDWDEDWADRRQELVLIGQGMDEGAIRGLLDSCLLTDDELEAYRTTQADDERDLQAMWRQEQVA